MYSRAALSPMKKARKRKERLIILSFLAPNLIGFLMFTVFPVFAAMFLSFSEWNIISDIKWVGFDNYSKLFTSKRFWQAVTHTLEYTVVSVPIGLLLAMFCKSAAICVVTVGLALLFKQYSFSSLFRYICRNC